MQVVAAQSVLSKALRSKTTLREGSNTRASLGSPAERCTLVFLLWFPVIIFLYIIHLSPLELWRRVQVFFFFQTTNFKDTLEGGGGGGGDGCEVGGRGVGRDSTLG